MENFNAYDFEQKFWMLDLFNSDNIEELDY